MTDIFEYPYNYSGGQNVSGLGNFIQYSSYITGDWLASGFILLIWIITFVLSLAAGSKKALAVSSFISFLFSVYFVRLSLIHFYIPITLIILTIIGALGSSKEEY